MGSSVSDCRGFQSVAVCRASGCGFRGPIAVVVAPDALGSADLTVCGIDTNGQSAVATLERSTSCRTTLLNPRRCRAARFLFLRSLAGEQCDLAQSQTLLSSSSIITTVAGNGTNGYSGDNGPATSAEINECDVAADAAGDIFIADTYNNCIREVNHSTGVITTVAGMGSGLLRRRRIATSAELNGQWAWP